MKWYKKESCHSSFPVEPFNDASHTFQSQGIYYSEEDCTEDWPAKKLKKKIYTDGCDSNDDLGPIEYIRRFCHEN